MVRRNTPSAVAPEKRSTECRSDLPGTLSLEELARSLVPRAFAAWRALSEFLSGDRDPSVRYIRNQDRREIARRRAWRRWLIGRLSLDEQFLPGRQDYEFLPKRLIEATDLKTRQKLVVQEARHLARAEVRSVARRRLGRAHDRLERKVLAATSAALRLQGTRVSGVEVRPTLGGMAPTERAEIPAEHLVHARIDILSGCLMEGGRQWRKVTVRLGQSKASEAQNASAETIHLEMSDEEIVAWMLNKQQELKSAQQPAGRDELIKLTMQRFPQLKQTTVRHAWDHRPGAPKRK